LNYLLKGINMNVARIRVVARHLHPNASWEEKDKNFRILHATFKRQVNESGILTIYKERQTYESKGEKRRRKRRESELQRRKEKESLRTNLREHFG